ncbi:MAG: glycosyltransferase family 1 protein [Chloroflexia bacterium]|nr:glycosyltransferase family 1 protein [Chloroflexia bacterium]
MTWPQPGKRIVLATYGSLGDLQPFLAIGAELRARGHEPIVATSEVYREIVSTANLGFAPVRPNRVPGQQEPDFLDRLFRERRPPAEIFREMFLPSLRDSLHDMLIATDGADAIVSHTLTAASRLVAESRQLVWVSTVMQPMGYLSRHEPPVLGPAWVSASLRALGPGPTARFLRAARWLTALWTRDWHALRAELGLPITEDQPLWEGQHAPRRSLGLFPRVLGSPQSDWPAQARVTGFPFYRLPDRALEPSLQQFLDAGDAPLVFTLGTTAVNDPGAFYEESAETARRMGRRAVLLHGRRVLDHFPDGSDGVIAVPYAPHDLLFPKALAIVHQGGIGTLAEALLAVKPMLIMPYGHDQADNAWRASRFGVARIIPRRKYRASVVRRELTRLLDDPVAREATARVSLAVARDRGVIAAADLIEAALS